MRNKSKIYTVSQVNGLVKEALANTLPGRLAVAGEISDWHRHQSGHCYFLLKDENGVLPCVMWGSNFRRVKFEIENGLAVVARGHVDVYTAGGKYQFYVDSIQPEGVGALQLAFEQMVRRLGDEGLFDDAHKKPLPAYPERIGILTSESGAALYDIQNSIHGRWPCVELFLYSVPVQGEGASEEIADALRDINRRNKQLRLDVLIVGRGGGSMEDLWAFNEEVLARAIYDSAIPVISAVGHEVDTTIADLVADARASTPTKAGVTAVPDMYEVLEQLRGIEGRLNDDIRARFKLARQNLKTILASAVFRNPLLPIHERSQRLDEIETMLSRLMRHFLAEARVRLHAGFEQLVRIEPHRLLGRRTVDLNNLQNRASSAIKGVLDNRRIQLTALANRLAGLNPKSVLRRGYSITTVKKTGLLVRELKDVRTGDLLITELAGKNLIESKVTKKQNRADKD